MKQQNEVSPSKAVAAKTVYEAFKVLKEEGGQLPGKDVIDKVGQRLQFTDWEKVLWKKREMLDGFLLCIFLLLTASRQVT